MLPLDAGAGDGPSVTGRLVQHRPPFEPTHVSGRLLSRLRASGTGPADGEQEEPQSAPHAGRDGVHVSPPGSTVRVNGIRCETRLAFTGRSLTRPGGPGVRE